MGPAQSSNCVPRYPGGFGAEQGLFKRKFIREVTKNYSKRLNGFGLFLTNIINKVNVEKGEPTIEYKTSSKESSKDMSSDDNKEEIKDRVEVIHPRTCSKLSENEQLLSENSTVHLQIMNKLESNKTLTIEEETRQNSPEITVTKLSPKKGGFLSKISEAAKKKKENKDKELKLNTDREPKK